MTLNHLWIIYYFFITFSQAAWRKAYGFGPAMGIHNLAAGFIFEKYMYWRQIMNDGLRPIEIFTKFRAREQAPWPGIPQIFLHVLVYCM